MDRFRALIAAAASGPSYAPDDRDLQDVRIAGLDLPVRATIALFAVTAIVLADYTGLTHVDPSARGIALERFVTYGLIPVAVVIFLFRDAAGRYGLRLGEWRWGAGLLAAGLVVMTPIILALATRPDFASYYGGRSGTLGESLVNEAIELFPAEFLFRGFLLFTLLRRIGPLAVVVVQVPFIFAHIGKPELELWSTFLGGSVFAWLDWRTRSIVWSALGHIYVLTLMLVAVGSA